MFTKYNTGLLRAVSGGREGQRNNAEGVDEGEKRSSIATTARTTHHTCVVGWG